MTKLKLFIFICFCALSTITQAQYSLTIDDVRFSNGQITDYTNATEKSIIIPDNFGGVAVETIGNNAFKNNALTHVIIPNSVRSIGNNAFQDNQLISVIIGNSVKSIGSWAFQNNQLTEVSIPNSVESIGQLAFQRNKLTHVSISNSVKSIERYVFSRNKLTEVIIPDSVNSIGEYAFSDNQLINVIIPNSVKSIGNWVFHDNLLTQVNIPNSVKIIGDATFHTNKLTEVIIPNSVKSIGGYAFYQNTGLTSFNLPTHYQGYSYSWSKSKKSGDEITDFTLDYVLYEGTKGSAVDFTITYTLDGGTNAANNPAKYTVKTETITLADASKTGRTFKGWYSEAAFTNQVTEIATGSIGDISLYAKYSDEYTLQLSDVIFSNGEITDYSNTTEKNIIIPDNFNDVAVTFIGENAFQNNQLTQVSIGNSVTSIGKNAFNGNTDTGLTSFNLPTDYQGYSYSWSNGKKSGDEITDFTLRYVLDENSKGDAVDFTISYTLNGGTNSNTNPANYIIETETIILADASKPGRTFKGWYSEATFTNQVTEIAAGSTGDISLYAKYSHEYTLQLSDVTFSNGEITDYTNPTEKNIIIPDNFNGVAVTSIGEDTFYNNKLTNVSIPNSVNSIGKNAFYENQLTEVSIGNSVNSIGESAFAGNQLTEVSIGNSVNSIGESAFAGNQLTEVSIGNSVNSIGESAFAGNQLTEVSIGNSVTSVGKDAFKDNKLTNVSIPNPVNSIGEGAFASNKLTEVSIGNSVNSIGKNAFYENQLTEVSIGNSVNSIGESAFAGNQLTEVSIGNSVNSIGEGAFANNHLTQISIPNSVNSIGESAFYNNKLTHVIIPNSVTSIGGYAFSFNTGLTSFNLPTHYQGYSYSWSNSKKSGDEITDFALSYELDEDSKGNAVDFTISYTLDGGTNAANNPADYTVETATITLADASKTWRTFKGWYSEATFTNQVTEIATGSTGDISLYAKYSDEYTLQLSDVDFSDGEIIDYTNATEKNIIIPDNFDGVAVTSIGEGAFQNNQLTQVSIPNSVNSIGKNAFSDNTGLTSFNLPADYQGSSYSWSNGKKSGDEITDFVLSYELDEGSKGDAVDFTISYTLDGGTNDANNPADYTVETATITLADASKDGYTFEGWYSDAAFTADNEVTEIATGSTGPKEFFAKFSDAITYNITYTLDGGTNDANNPADYTVESATITLAEASKDGYTFGGWYSDAAFTADNEVTEIATGSTGPKEFFAKFSEFYIITYNLDGGTNGGNPISYTVETATITLAEASKDHHTFEGWYSDAAFTNQVTEIATGSTGPKEFFAKFSDAITYDITYTLDGGTNDANNPADYTVESATITLAEASKDGYTFEGWYSDAAFTADNEVTEIATGSTGPKKFFAKFSDAITYDITYTLDGGTNDANNPADYTVETATITLAEATKDGYTFEGWYSEAAFTNQVKEIATGSTGDVILYAKFDAITYDIAYTLYGGTNAANNPADYTVETATITLAEASKTGRTFKGWYSEAAFTNQVTEIATGSTGPKEFFAKFSDAITYDISYTLYGGTNAANNPADYTVETATITLAEASKDGYTFGGWYSDAAFTTGNEVTEIATGSTGHKEFFAKFSDAITYDISYTLDGGTNAANNPADYTVETATITLAEASKDGYTFEGWYSDAAFTADNEVTEIATGSTGPKKFFAKFSDAITYDITYTLDGGTNDANNPADYTVETATITLADASKDGYTFEGWYSEDAFTNQVTEIATGSTGDVVLFAKYSEIALGIYTKNIKVFNFYPNPSIDFIQTELEVFSLTIRSISGSKVKQFEEGSFFDISNLKSGVYILLAIDKNGDTYKSKLLKE